MSRLDLELFDAVSKSEIERVQTLLSQNARVDYNNPKYNHKTSLHKAFEIQNRQLLNILIQHLLQHVAETRDTSCHDLIVNVMSQHFESSLSHNITATTQNQSNENSTSSHENKDQNVINKVKQAIDAIARGEFVVVQDSEDRENEGDLIIASQMVTPEKIAFMVNETSGIICISLESERCQQLQLPQMVEKNTESHSTAFTQSVDYKFGTSTGISAADRSATILALVDESSHPDDFNRPGHIFPLRCRQGGVLTRAGHTEASADLARLAGLFPSGVICEIVNKDGSMARGPALKEFAKKHRLQHITIEQLIYYRQITEQANSN